MADITGHGGAPDRPDTDDSPVEEASDAASGEIDDLVDPVPREAGEAIPEGDRHLSPEPPTGVEGDADSTSPWMPWPPAEETVEPEKAPRRAITLWSAGLIGLSSALIGAVVGVSVLMFTQNEPVALPPVTVIERIETRTVEIGTNEVVTSAAEVARRVLPSIVTVEQGRFEAADDGDVFVRTGGGSGVVFDTAGHLVTNHHVIEGAEAVRIVFADGRIVPATVVGSDSLTDIAVIAVDLDDLTPIRLGSTETLYVGDAAYAIGNPLTLEGGASVTSGVISAFNRRVRLQGGRELFGLLQTDAPITRGSSGGALVDGEGRLVGITTAVAVSDLGQEGLGFAIPVELVIRIATDIIDTGGTTHAFLGISGATHYTSNPDGSSAPSGVEVAEPIEGTAAANAGIIAGDVIVSYEGTAISTMEQLILRLRLNRVGDIIRLGIMRADEHLTLEVELLERPEGV
jgi:S1-C subfamily serine protease